VELVFKLLKVLSTRLVMLVYLLCYYYYTNYIYLDLQIEDNIFISDREKGLTIAVSEQFPESIHLHCCQHIADNLQQRFGNKIRPLFWAAARAKDTQTFKAKIEVLQEQSQAAYNYLLKIDVRTWTRAGAKAARYGYDTSNVIESLNSAWSDIRCLPPLRMMDAIYSYCMKMVYDRSVAPQASPMIANVPMARFEDRLKTARRYQVYPSGNGMYQVENPDSGRKFIVNTRENYCDCYDFEEYISPCSHAIAVAQNQADNPLDLFYDMYSTEAYKATYSRHLVPVSIENLQSDDSILPPLTRKQAGRPRTKRFRKGQWKRKQTRCSNCLDWGHNKKGCRGQPVPSGRQERAREWLGERAIQEEEKEEEDDAEEDEEKQEEEQEEEQEKEPEVESEDQLSDLESDLFNSMEIDKEEGEGKGEGEGKEEGEGGTSEAAIASIVAKATIDVDAPRATRFGRGKK
jgi:hypothetical protein